MCQNKNYWRISSFSKIIVCEWERNDYCISAYTITKGFGSYVGNKNLGMNEKIHENYCTFRLMLSPRFHPYHNIN